MKTKYTRKKTVGTLYIPHLQMSYPLELIADNDSPAWYSVFVPANNDEIKEAGQPSAARGLVYIARKMVLHNMPHYYIERPGEITALVEEDENEEV